MSQEDSIIVQQFKQKIASEINRRWCLDSIDLSSPLLIASTLDPRFKHLKFLADEDHVTVKETILSRMEKVTSHTCDPDESTVSKKS